MNYLAHLKINFLPSILTNSRAHWSAKHREIKTMQKHIRVALGRLIPEKPLKKINIELVRHSSVQPDFDNLVSSFKGAIDALVIFGVIENDKPENIAAQKYSWKKAPPKMGCIEIFIEGVS